MNGLVSARHLSGLWEKSILLRRVNMLSELKEVHDIWKSGERPSDEQLEALKTALAEKESREPLEDLESDIWVALKIASRFNSMNVWGSIERVFAEEPYWNEKKSRYFIHIEAGDHHFEGDFFYWLTFKEQICRRDFNKIMEEAKKPNDRYASLSNREFQEKYGILSFEAFNADYNGYLEPLWVTVDKDGNIIEEDDTEFEADFEGGNEGD